MATKPSTRKRRVFTWYIEPLDLNTNESLARELSEENAMEIHDSEGIPRQVYLIPPKKLTKFRNSKSQGSFRFNVLKKEGGGKIYLANFLPRIQARKRLEQLGLPKAAQAKAAA